MMESWREIAKNCIFLKHGLSNLNYAENENLSGFKQDGGPIHQQMLYFVIPKRLFVPSSGLKNPNISNRRYFK